MKPVSSLSDDELKAELSTFGFTAGPITGTTRSILQKKLEAFRAGSGSISKPKSSAKKTKTDTTSTSTSVTAPMSSKSQENLAADTSSLSRFDGDLSFNLNDSSASSASSFKATSFKTGPTIKNRTPTPPRNQTGAGKRTPLRQQALSGGGLGIGTTSSSSSPYISGSGSSGLFGQTSTSTGSIRNSRSLFGKRSAFENEFAQENEEEEEDDHMESSRILLPQSRFRPSYGSYAPMASKPSPVDKLKTFGQSAWGFFSRPKGTFTPCSDSDHKYAGYTPVNKYKRHSPLSYGSGDRFMDSKKAYSPDFSYWIPRAVLAFFAVLIAAYMSRAHPDVVSGGFNMTRDFVIATFHFLYNYAIMPIFVFLFVALIIFGAYQLIAYRNRQKTEEKRKLMLLVERITDIIYESGAAGVAEPHVRDMIMPPTKRSEAEYKRWQEAARFINNEDSRIRTEIRLINGTECNVWIWTGVEKQRWQGTGN